MAAISGWCSPPAGLQMISLVWASGRGRELRPLRPPREGRRSQTRDAVGSGGLPRRLGMAPSRQSISDSPALRCDTPNRVFENCGRNWVRTCGFSLVRRKQLTKRSSSQSRLHALDLRKPCPEMPRDAWESLHGGSRKWFPEQRPRSPQSGTEQRLPAPLPITGTSAPTSLKHQVRTAARPSMPKPARTPASATGRTATVTKSGRPARLTNGCSRVTPSISAWREFQPGGWPHADHPVR